MRIAIVGDIHGRNSWTWVKNSISTLTKVVFLGDYVDSQYYGAEEILNNLRDIINFKKEYPDKVVLLLGNHDYAYIFDRYATSGFRAERWYDTKELLESNWNLFDVAWGTYTTVYGGDYALLSHAGLTSEFYKMIVDERNSKGSVLNAVFTENEMAVTPIHEILNVIKDNSSLLWVCGYVRGGAHRTGSIIWADKSELKNDPFPGIHQIVGHTQSKFIEKHVTKYGQGITFVDSAFPEICFSMVMDL